MKRHHPENPAVASFMEVASGRNIPPRVTEHWLTAGTQSTVYGPYATRMISHADQLVRSGQVDPEIATRAVKTAAGLFHRADMRYHFDPRARVGEPLSDEALKEHQENVLEGTITLVPQEAATTRKEGVSQVTEADRSGSEDPSIGPVLAQINYDAFFGPQTMSSGARTIARGEIDGLLETVDSTHEAMPHLDVSNWAIGQTVAGIYQELSHAPNPHLLRIVDVGSGKGSTLAAIMSSILAVEDPGYRVPLAITGLETTPGFYKELVSFADRNNVSADLGLERVSLPQLGHEPISRFGDFRTVHTDAVNALLSDKLVTSGKNNLTVVTGNYSWHRIDSDSKEKILNKFAEADTNVIFLIGDLAENGSEINRRYFNLGTNGPLNYGNRTLSDQFAHFGYSVVNLDHVKPASLDPRLARRISREHDANDGHLWIAYRGQLAHDVLRLAA